MLSLGRLRALWKTPGLVSRHVQSFIHASNLLLLTSSSGLSTRISPWVHPKHCERAIPSIMRRLHETAETLVLRHADAPTQTR